MNIKTDELQTAIDNLDNRTLEQIMDTCEKKLGECAKLIEAIQTDIAGICKEHKSESL